MIVGAIHHFSDQNGCLDNIIDFLPKGGMCIVVERPKYKWPLPFARVHIQDLRATPTAHVIIIPHLEKRKDVVVEKFDEFFSYEMKKERWYNMIRGRFMSNFEKYTDDELEKSIEELEKERFGGLKDDDNITINDNYIITKLTKII